MSPIQYQLTQGNDGRKTLTVFDPGDGVTTVNDDHPKFEEVVKYAADPHSTVEEVKRLVDVAAFVAERLRDLSRDVRVEYGQVFYRGDRVEPVIESQILEYVSEDRTTDWLRLVRFLENIMDNPNANSREQLFKFLTEHGLVITNDGSFIAYKGTCVGPDYRSVRKGPAIVDGVLVNDPQGVPNRVGSVVEFDRAKVNDDPNVGCAQGLHVGSHEYASGWSDGGFLTCKVNPRDVVSVPYDSAHAKVRTSRYEVLALAPSAKLANGSWDPDDDDAWDED
jgi:hypothetical protein